MRLRENSRTDSLTVPFILFILLASRLVDALFTSGSPRSGEGGAESDPVDRPKSRRGRALPRSAATAACGPTARCPCFPQCGGCHNRSIAGIGVLVSTADAEVGAFGDAPVAVVVRNAPA